MDHRHSESKQSTEDHWCTESREDGVEGCPGSCRGIYQVLAGSKRGPPCIQACTAGEALRSGGTWRAGATRMTGGALGAQVHVMRAEGGPRGSSSTWLLRAHAVRAARVRAGRDWAVNRRLVALYACSLFRPKACPSASAHVARGRPAPSLCSTPTPCSERADHLGSAASLPPHMLRQNVHGDAECRQGPCVHCHAACCVCTKPRLLAFAHALAHACRPDPVGAEAFGTVALKSLS